MMDDGIFYDKFQRPLFARGAFIIMTTNAAHEVILENRDHPKLKQMVNVALQKYFRLSFLNRFNAICISQPFTEIEYRMMAKELLRKKADKIEERYGWKIQAGKKVVNFVAKYGQSPIFGQRPLERLMENILMGAIAEFQLRIGAIAKGSIIKLRLKSKHSRSFLVTVGEQTLTFHPDLENNNGGFEVK